MLLLLNLPLGTLESLGLQNLGYKNYRFHSSYLLMRNSYLLFHTLVLDLSLRYNLHPLNHSLLHKSMSQ
jgi:hypothetical protein